MEFNNKLRKTIVDYREKENITRAQMANDLGVPVTTLQSWELGSIPRAELFLRLLALTDSDPRDFMPSDEPVMA